MESYNNLLPLPINHKLDHNGHYLTGGISAGISTFNISGISSIQPRDLLLVDDEFMSIVEVGFSTNVAGEVLGPISGVIASGAGVTFPTVSVKRGAVGTAATTHFDGANVQIYRGSFNIVKNELHFTDPPKGNNRARRNESNLPYVQAAFSGRTFLRSNYDTNMVFDDISDEFTGIGKTFSLKVGGADTTGVDSGNGILFINGVFKHHLLIIMLVIPMNLPKMLQQESVVLSTLESVLLMEHLLNLNSISTKTKFQEVDLLFP